jgi:hypothetical protein
MRSKKCKIWNTFLHGKTHKSKTQNHKSSHTKRKFFTRHQIPANNEVALFTDPDSPLLVGLQTTPSSSNYKPITLPKFNGFINSSNSAWRLYQLNVKFYDSCEVLAGPAHEFVGSLCKPDSMGPQGTTYLDFYSFNKFSPLQLLLVVTTIMQETRLGPVCSLRWASLFALLGWDDA